MTMDLSPEGLRALADLCQKVRHSDAGAFDRDAALWEAAAHLRTLAARADRPAAEVGEEAVRGHKWFDGECQDKGCQSLVWKSRYEAAVQGRREFRQAYRDARAAAISPASSPGADEVREPVAWMRASETGQAQLTFDRFRSEAGWTETPLYTAEDLAAIRPMIEAAAAERAREACAQMADNHAEKCEYRRVASLKAANSHQANIWAAQRNSAYTIAEVIRALPLADLLRPEGAQAEGEASRG